MITLIAAIGENNELGKDNQLIWHLPDDFKRFKAITSGHFIIMGRKTFESFPKPLPNRTHVIVTRQKNYAPKDCIIVNSIKDGIAACPIDEAIYIIGGGEIYNQSINLADKLELTRVHHTFEADTYFPKLNMDLWQLEFEEFHPKDNKHNFDFTFLTYSRKTE
ncbi:MAG TPA: dihydrofolate reductase [Flavobacterium sp.]|jgi:dihydrofolate reductase|uniref:dihydrofolate reductase n=1 Tax=Flavobacterium sp. TaxID=239 RepID=UPI002C488426|nr:dihydrofolate reductase [Flavobacterium sp.]MCA0349960.1 dihydrofolate reductase [Bacteroidota bacterium]HPW97402.1 dihydrofolate reductase [Flavobacterium sp.]HQA74183.1 dihydrofolate reductase [Flavobacterium sp.]